MLSAGPLSIASVCMEQKSLHSDDVIARTTESTNVSCSSEPDGDAIKMFVGQIPRHWSETDCRRLFETYGPVFSCNILRDKQTQGSKGCCFVTFYHRKDAIDAQGALHNIKVIEGMHHPVQMKPADTENRNERKLFVGQLSKRHSEDDVRNLFAKYGHIEDCSVLRDQDGKSRGCAFVTFSNRSCAVIATKEMHHSQTMEGCAAPLVVKFADTQKDKDVKHKTGLIGTTGVIGQPAAVSAGAGLSALGGLNSAVMQQLGLNGQNVQALASVMALLNGGGGATATPMQALASQQSQQANVLQLLGNAHLLQHQANVASQSATMDAYAQAHMAQQIAQAQAAHVQAQQNQLYALQGYAVQQQVQQSVHAQNGYAGGLAAVKTSSPVAATLATHTPAISLAQYGGTASGAAVQFDPYQAAALQQYALLNLQATTAAATANSVAPTSIVGNGDVKGPDGANLFIYHLPQDFGDADLLNTFAPFGNVLSAKVFIDKVTNLSKCFGFVSYDNSTSAANAIQAMNQFQIGTKRLKVQLKVDRGNPYHKV